MPFSWILFGHSARDSLTGRFISMDSVFARPIEERLAAALPVIRGTQRFQFAISTLREKRYMTEEQAERVMQRTLTGRTSKDQKERYLEALLEEAYG